MKDLTSKRVLISAGGGGHTGYAYALAQRLYGEASLSFRARDRARAALEM